MIKLFNLNRIGLRKSFNNNSLKVKKSFLKKFKIINENNSIDLIKDSLFKIMLENNSTYLIHHSNRFNTILDDNEEFQNYLKNNNFLDQLNSTIKCNNIFSINQDTIVVNIDFYIELIINLEYLSDDTFLSYERENSFQRLMNSLKIRTNNNCLLIEILNFYIFHEIIKKLIDSNFKLNIVSLNRKELFLRYNKLILRKDLSVLPLSNLVDNFEKFEDMVINYYQKENNNYEIQSEWAFKLEEFPLKSIYSINSLFSEVAFKSLKGNYVNLSNDPLIKNESGIEKFYQKIIESFKERLYNDEIYFNNSQENVCLLSLIHQLGTHSKSTIGYKVIDTDKDLFKLYFFRTLFMFTMEMISYFEENNRLDKLDLVERALANEYFKSFIQYEKFQDIFEKNKRFENSFDRVKKYRIVNKLEEI
ncbi:hypothetical protein Bp8pS_088 [Bacillus phage vB_BpuM-BpSp]|nr:hypothetical protein Bp8pS_088 [Bacillus phage vB_BpuM-BpSp]